MADGDSRNTSGIASHEAPEGLNQPGLPCLNIREIKEKNEMIIRIALRLSFYIPLPLIMIRHSAHT